MTKDTQPVGLYAKMARIMGEIKRIPKSGRNEQQKYNYATEGDVADTIRALLAQYNIAFFAAMTGVEQDTVTSQRGATGWHTRVTMEYTFACGDTGQVHSAPWAGESLSYDDKGISKAATLSQKYFLLKTFSISTGDPEDDPDSGPGEPSQNAGGNGTQQKPDAGKASGKRQPQEPAGEGGGKPDGGPVPLEKRTYLKKELARIHGQTVEQVEEYLLRCKAATNPDNKLHDGMADYNVKRRYKELKPRLDALVNAELNNQAAAEGKA